MILVAVHHGKVMREWHMYHTLSMRGMFVDLSRELLYIAPLAVQTSIVKETNVAESLVVLHDLLSHDPSQFRITSMDQSRQQHLPSWPLMQLAENANANANAPSRYYKVLAIVIHAFPCLYEYDNSTE